jgi:hypothetical protein
MAYPYSHSDLPGIYQSTGYYNHPTQTPPYHHQTPLPSGWTTQVQIPCHIHATGYDSTGSFQNFVPTNIPPPYPTPSMIFSAEINSNIYANSSQESQETSFSLPPTQVGYSLQRMPARHGNVGASDMLGRARAARVRSQRKPTNHRVETRFLEHLH